MRILSSFEIGEPMHRLSRQHRHRRVDEETQTDEALVGPQGQEGLAEFGVEHDFVRLIDAVERAGRAAGLEALVDAGEEVRRHQHGLDRSELRAFDFARRAAELTRRKDLPLKPPAGFLLNAGDEHVQPFVDLIMVGQRAQPHGGGLVVRRHGGVSRRCSERRTERQYQRDVPRPAPERVPDHVFRPSAFIMPHSNATFGGREDSASTASAGS